jgi:hypothetical protein
MNPNGVNFLAGVPPPYTWMLAEEERYSSRLSLGCHDFKQLDGGNSVAVDKGCSTVASFGVL